MSFEKLDTKYEGSMDFSQYPFPLSDFQKHSIHSFMDGKNVLVTAHTGSGKTLPAEYAINYITQNTTKKIIYTSPIKSLSNQKFYEFKTKFPEADVGILTGDIKYNPTGNVIIMTTEILRNLLFNKKIHDYKLKLDIEIDIYNDVHTVVFDEIHYINDKDRGKVWEECLILLPPSIQLIMLSATIANPEQLCNWLKDIKGRDIVLTTNEKRVVPLRHSIFTTYLHSFKNRNFNQYGSIINQLDKKVVIFSDEHNKFNINLYNECFQGIRKTNQGLDRNNIYNELVGYLKENGLNPSIFFCFSRYKCESLAKKITHLLLEPHEVSEVEFMINQCLQKCDNRDEYLNLQQFNDIKNLLRRGICFHHSGLLPIFKEIIELLYSKNLVKVLFATETFAVGVNMPTKTVVFSSLEKYTDLEYRLLQTHEYLQMAGRAGRRGIDTEGLVILLPDNLPEPLTMKNLICGTSQVIKSKFTFNYQLILKIFINGVTIDNIINQSLVNRELTTQNRLLKDELDRITLPEIDIEECRKYERLTKNDSDNFIKLSQSAIKKNQQMANEIKSRDGFLENYQLYLDNKVMINRHTEILDELSSNTSFMSEQISKIIDILFKYEYISNDKPPINSSQVQTKGIIACMINECNELLMTELLMSGYLDNLDYREIASVLSVFGDCTPVNKNGEQKYHDNVDSNLYTIIDMLDELANDCINEEHSNHLYTNSDWNINRSIVGAVYEWLEGGNFQDIVKKYNIYEGSFIKDLLKIYNISANLGEIAKIAGKNNLSIETDKILENILRDIVNVDSLYIKI